MSEFKRRDLLSYYNNEHIEAQKKQYEDICSNGNAYLEFLEFNKKSNVLNKSHSEIDISIKKIGSIIFDCKSTQFLVRSNIYDSIDLIYKTIIDMHENILIAENCFPYYERSSYLNMARSIKVHIDFNNNINADEILELIRSKNAKILTISTRNSDASYQQTFEFIKQIVENSSALIIVDDTFNDKNITDFVDLAKKYQNFIILKSTLALNKVIDNMPIFIIACEDIISSLQSFTNYLDINIFNKAFILFLLTYNKSDYTDSQVVEPKETINEPKEEVNTNNIVIEKKEISKPKEEIIQENVAEKQEQTKYAPKKEAQIDKPKNNLIPGSKQSLITEVTKYNFISIFSSNSNHVYILSSIPLYSKLVDAGIVLKRYNSSNGEILRLAIENINQNTRILSIIEEVKNTKVFGIDFI